MKFITEFSEVEKYKNIGLAIDEIKEIVSLSEIQEATKQLPKGEFKTQEEKDVAAGNQGFKNVMTVINKILVEHTEELVKINHLFWKPETVKKPVKVTEYDENGFLIEDYKRDNDGHVVYEEYQETAEDYPSVFKTIAKLPVLMNEEPEILNFFTSLGGLKSIL